MKLTGLPIFEKSNNVPDEGKTTKILSNLLALDYNHDPQGIMIQELLQLKYFPERYYDENIKELQAEYDQSPGFTPTGDGICNAHLAYHILSGRLDALYEKLNDMELPGYFGVYVYAKLEVILAANSKDFELRFSCNEPKGYV